MEFVSTSNLARFSGLATIAASGVAISWIALNWSSDSLVLFIVATTFSLLGVFLVIMRFSVAVERDSISFRFLGLVVYKNKLSQNLEIEEIPNFSPLSVGGIGWRKISRNKFAYVVGKGEAVSYLFENGDSVLISCVDTPQITALVKKNIASIGAENESP